MSLNAHKLIHFVLLDHIFINFHFLSLFNNELFSKISMKGYQKNIMILHILVNNAFKLIKPLKLIGFPNFYHINFESNLSSSIMEYN